MFRFCLLLFLALAGCLGEDAPAKWRGAVRVVDGDTLAMGKARLRLHGIDAPELHQTCSRHGQSWPCGRYAQALLAEKLAGKRVVCTAQSAPDRYGRPIVACRAGRQDLGRFMVLAGAAVAYTRYSKRYEEEEAAARAARRGIWAGEMVLPEHFRRQRAARKS